MYHRHFRSEVTVFLEFSPHIRLVVATGQGYLTGLARLEAISNSSVLSMTLFYLMLVLIM